MALRFEKLHPHFAAEASGVDLRQVSDPQALHSIRDAMDVYAVLVFRNQPFTNKEQLAFAQRFDGGKVHTGGVSAVSFKDNRHGYDGFSDISNVTPNGQIMAIDDPERVNKLTNRMWHTDVSYLDTTAHYSMLSARTVPPVRADTEWADTRAAYDALDEETKRLIDGLKAHHSAGYNKHLLGFELAPEAAAKLKGAAHPIVRAIPRSGRRALYLAAHASHIIDWPLPDGRLMLRELTEHATQPEFVYRHEWRPNDFVIWDNHATMHRGRRYDDLKYKRELVRVTTLETAA